VTLFLILYIDPTQAVYYLQARVINGESGYTSPLDLTMMVIPGEQVRGNPGGANQDCAYPFGLTRLSSHQKSTGISCEKCGLIVLL
jgi:hypothetical protein